MRYQAPRCDDRCIVTAAAVRRAPGARPAALREPWTAPAVHEVNRTALTDLTGMCICRGYGRRPPDGAIPDMGSSAGPTYGEQEGSAWNGRSRCLRYRPLFALDPFGDPERCLLRFGNVHGG